MITSTYIYWLTRLDNIQVVAVLLTAISTVGTILSVGGIFDELRSERLGRWLSRIMPTTLVLSIVTLVFLPTTKEMAAITVIPKIVNSEKIQTIGNDVYDLAIEWLQELHSEKRRQQ